MATPSPTIDPAAPVISLLTRYGPGSSEPAPSPAESLQYVRGLANSHYENFSVLSSLVPPALRPHFAAVYAFCRWSDDLGDETGNDDAARTRSLDLLAWWRTEMEACFAGNPRHPVFIALHPTIIAHRLPIEPFSDLITAFEQDQRIRHYQTWNELLGYCRNSANPVGRLVLMLAGYSPLDDAPGRFAMSDSICTALQLTNFWQDVRRDMLERARVYIPSADTGITPEMLQDWINRPQDPAARVPYIKAVRSLVHRTRDLFDQGAALPNTLAPSIAPVVWLFAAGGRHVLDTVEKTGCTTLWRRPRLGKPAKLALIARAWFMARSGRQSAGPAAKGVA